MTMTLTILYGFACSGACFVGFGHFQFHHFGRGASEVCRVHSTSLQSDSDRGLRLIHAFSPVDHFTKDMEYLDGLMPPTAVIV